MFALIPFSSIRTAAGWHLPYRCLVDVASGADDIERDLGRTVDFCDSMSDNKHPVEGYTLAF